jgi:3-hydroxybutyryl-CoA dehydrogenase
MTQSSIHICVIGSGAMGIGITQVAALAGDKVFLYDNVIGKANESLIDLEKRLNRLVEKEKISAADKSECMSRIEIIEGFEQLNEVDLVVEAIVENKEIKTTLFKELENYLPDHAIIASNTSSFLIEELGYDLKRPENFAGMHFFNPAPVISLVEVIKGLGTSQQTVDRLYERAIKWQKKPVHVKSSPGFIVNRVARPFYSVALSLLDEGKAEPDQIDLIMRSCGQFKMGPFELIDLIGLDINLNVSHSIFNAFNLDPRYRPSVKQNTMVRAGYLGQKSAKGFYTYPREKKAKIPELIRTDKAFFTSIEAAQEGLQVPDGCWIKLTDGRSAFQYEIETNSPVCFFDLAADFQTCEVLALSFSPGCSQGEIQSTIDYLQSEFGLKCITIADTPAMVVMRTVCRLANEASLLIEQGIAQSDDIDFAMNAGVNYPIGPMQWAERLGWKNITAVLSRIEKQYGDGAHRSTLFCPAKSLEERE